MSTKIVAAGKLQVERLQTREATRTEYVDELAERMKAGDTFPPITVVTDGKDSWLCDGIHRLDAAIQAKAKIGVDEIKGDRLAAIERACGANLAHGMRRTNADKRRAVRLALKEFDDRSNRSIAELCAVSDQLVRDEREALEEISTRKREKANAIISQSENGEPAKREVKRVGRDGIVRKVPAKPTDFDPDSLESQPPEKPKKSGKAQVSVDDRKACHTHLGGLIRALKRVGVYEEFEPSLSQIAKRLKEI